MMETAINNFPSQFSWQPLVTGKLTAYKKFVVCGMGGSHLAADVLLTLNPSLDLIIHSDYGLPSVDIKQRLIIASSYSGNTEEVIDGYAAARKKKLPLLVIAIGGKLIEMARRDKVPYILLPNTGIQPRSALGFSLIALLKVTGQAKLMTDARALVKRLSVSKAKKIGTALTLQLKNHVPIIYSSRRNVSVAYNWKIKFNETGKIPAFCNVVPELNHNEMTGFDGSAESKKLASQFHVIMLTDSADHVRIHKRMNVLTKQYQDRKIPVTTVSMTGKTQTEKIFSSLLVADWCAVTTASLYGSKAEQVPMVEEFKRLMK